MMSVHVGGTPEVHHGAPCVPWLTVKAAGQTVSAIAEEEHACSTNS